MARRARAGESRGGGDEPREPRGWIGRGGGGGGGGGVEEGGVAVGEVDERAHAVDGVDDGAVEVVVGGPGDGAGGSGVGAVGAVGAIGAIGAVGADGADVAVSLDGEGGEAERGVERDAELRAEVGVEGAILARGGLGAVGASARASRGRALARGEQRREERECCQDPLADIRVRRARGDRDRDGERDRDRRRERGRLRVLERDPRHRPPLRARSGGLRARRTPRTCQTH